MAGFAPALAAELEPLGGVPSLRSARDESRDELGTRSPPGLLKLPCPVKIKVRRGQKCEFSLNHAQT